MNCVFDNSATEVPMVQLKIQMFLGTALDCPELKEDMTQMAQERNSLSICKIFRVRPRKIKHLTQKNSVSLVVIAFAEITPCAFVIIVLNQEILLL